MKNKMVTGENTPLVQKFPRRHGELRTGLPSLLRKSRFGGVCVYALIAGEAETARYLQLGGHPI